PIMYTSQTVAFSRGNVWILERGDASGKARPGSCSEGRGSGATSPRTRDPRRMRYVLPWSLRSIKIIEGKVVFIESMEPIPDGAVEGTCVPSHHRGQEHLQHLHSLAPRPVVPRTEKGTELNEQFLSRQWPELSSHMDKLTDVILESIGYPEHAVITASDLLIQCVDGSPIEGDI
ncbi:hypothetical protein PMAYCL1PPCAC_28113, partial [Pristionchus mayeri]